MAGVFFRVPVHNSDNVEALRSEVIAFFFDFDDDPRRYALGIMHVWIAANKDFVWGWFAGRKQEPVALRQDAQPYHYTIEYGLVDDLLSQYGQVDHLSQTPRFFNDPGRVRVTPCEKLIIYLQSRHELQAMVRFQ